MKNSQEKITVAVAGATGYGGLELVRLLCRHPGAQITYLGSASSAGKRLEEVYPHFAERLAFSVERLDFRLQTLDPKTMTEAAEVVLLALPAGKSAAIVPSLLEAGAKVIDGGPDFRLRDPRAYPHWYGFEHPAPDLLKEAVYGLPELYAEKIRASSLVAAPGCYPTAALLPLAPLLKEKLILPEVIIDAKSGLSGAGRSALSLPYHFSEAAEDVCAYSLPFGSAQGKPTHRHLPEIEQEVASLLPPEEKANIVFTPHLVPMVRGILATVYAELGVESSELRDLAAVQAQLLGRLAEFYSGAAFVHVGEALPHTKWAVGTNHAFLSARVSPDGKKAILLCAIDNLGKGLAGQMVQCLNLMCGFPETAGLEDRAVYP